MTPGDAGSDLSADFNHFVLIQTMLHSNGKGLNHPGAAFSRIEHRLLSCKQRASFLRADASLAAKRGQSFELDSHPAPRYLRCSPEGGRGMQHFNRKSPVASGLLAAFLPLAALFLGCGKSGEPALAQRQRLGLQIDVLTWHNDNALTGLNPNEALLTPTNVNATDFGQLFSYALDGYAYAQPLYMSGLEIPGQGTRNVVFDATQHDSVYAFDANGSAPGILWQRSF